MSRGLRCLLLVDRAACTRVGGRPGPCSQARQCSTFGWSSGSVARNFALISADASINLETLSDQRSDALARWLPACLPNVGAACRAERARGACVSSCGPGGNGGRGRAAELERVRPTTRQRSHLPQSEGGVCAGPARRARRRSGGDGGDRAVERAGCWRPRARLPLRPPPARPPAARRPPARAARPD
jgi:hypothetical protein